MSLGAPEILLIVAVLLLLFGGKKIPELMKGLGQGMREFKKASRMEDDVIEKTPVDSKNQE
jgi:sec-independent protein translocase protein TatA